MQIPKGKTLVTGFNFRQTQPAQTLKQLRSRMTASVSSTLNLDYLEACAPIYKISSNVDDYIFGTERALVADLSNRNGHEFDLEELLRFNIGGGCLNYKTFEGKPMLINHEYVLPKAIGVHIQSRLIQDGPYVAVELISACDTTKNKEAAEYYRSGECSFSMGALAGYFQCSVCGVNFEGDKPCVHCNDTGILRPHNYNGKLKLAYMRARDIEFIEHSLLIGEPPADPRALSGAMKIC